ncbi:MAG: RimK family protein [Planctomycetes bacterium]|nr:RimK family protein [Planctomycetota bacterium]
MNALVVVSDPKDWDPAEWDLDPEKVELVSADAYLAGRQYADGVRRRVVNLCRTLRYQRSGYYVSLLAEARGHRPLPTIGTIQDLKSRTLIRAAGSEHAELIEKTLATIHSDKFELSVYFGRNVAQRHNALANVLFRTFPAPMLRAFFEKHAKTGHWELTNVAALDVQDVPPDHRSFVLDALADHVAGRGHVPRRRTPPRYDLAILRDPSDAEPASDKKAIRRFVEAGKEVGFAVEVITRDDYSRTAEFDALFIRDTTNVNHYTYRFAQKAKSEGLVVVDDPDTIVKCMNKVYLAEVMHKHGVPTPKTMVVTSRRASRVESTLGLPCVLKQPDSAFSAGVVKVDTSEELRTELARLLSKSALVIAQEFRPTDFDWRIGVLDGQPLYACKYYMARRHWQIIERDAKSGQTHLGRFDTMPVEQVPTKIVSTAIKAASLYGDGLFGVDLKEDHGDVFVIEVNDNPSIDGGIEDQVLKDELYLRIMRYLMGRVEQRKRVGRVV